VGKADRPSPCRALVCLAFDSFGKAIALSLANPRGCQSDCHFWKSYREAIAFLQSSPSKTEGGCSSCGHFWKAVVRRSRFVSLGDRIRGLGYGGLHGQEQKGVRLLAC
jgi:hypothetical protein